MSSLNSLLEAHFEQSIKRAEKISPSYKVLWTNLYALFQAGGKRLRPQMTIFSYEAFGGKDLDAIMPIAAAQELVHFSLLIHDDIIDRDYVRYGVANISARQRLVYSQYISSPEDLTHFAMSSAILAGDLMLSSSRHLIATSKVPSQEKETAERLLSEGIFEVAGGELLDTELSFMPYNDGDALKVAFYKTASYSFVLPLLTGARLAHATQKQCDILRDCATSLGIAYQLTDDILGVFGDEQKTGKSTVSDIVEGKRTYLVEMALREFSAADEATFMLAFGNHLATPLEVQAAKRMLDSSGARKKTEQKISEYADRALAFLDKLQWSPQHREQFKDIINKATNRNF